MGFLPAIRRLPVNGTGSAGDLPFFPPLCIQMCFPLLSGALGKPPLYFQYPFSIFLPPLFFCVSTIYRSFFSSTSMRACRRLSPSRSRNESCAPLSCPPVRLSLCFPTAQRVLMRPSQSSFFFPPKEEYNRSVDGFPRQGASL